ncbi:MAG: tetratricopeptide repeat protein [Bacteroidetes bacterium]|nr:tetratricopeptide repeat protein [Bacteroidota bacterium]
MNSQEAVQTHEKICTLIISNRILEAIILLENFISYSKLTAKLDEVFEQKRIYIDMLNYTIGNVIDPHKALIHNNIKRSLLEKADATLQYAQVNMGLHIFHLNRELKLDLLSDFSEQTIHQLDELSFKEELDDILVGQPYEKSNTININFDEIIRKSFHLAWLSERLKETDIELYNKILNSERFTIENRCQIVSGLSLGLQRLFDKEKFKLLFSYFHSSDQLVRQRALVGLFIAFVFHDKRISLYPEIQIILNKIISETPKELLKHLLLQVLNACDTENISKKFREEILPEVIKIESKLKNKFKFDPSLSDDLGIEKNPDWESIIQDSPNLMDKLQEFTDLQMEGSDVLMGTFSMLKHFDFFKKEENWFLPFTENTTVNEYIAKSEENDILSASLAYSPFMCNSDKFSLLLNLQYMQESQKRTLLNYINAETDQLKELVKDKESVDPLFSIKLMITHTVQDLYRFIKLYPYHTEIPDIFLHEWNIFEINALKLLIAEAECKNDIAHFYFNRSIYFFALPIYQDMASVEHDNPIYYEKIGFCFEQLKNYSNAIENYKKAELFDVNHNWIYKRIAWCFRKLKDYENALNYYLEAEKNEPENTIIQTQIGYCLIELNQYNEALNHFNTIYYNNIDNQKLWRPLAWCYLNTGKLEEAETLYLQIIENNPTYNDYFNLGHLLWAKGYINKAIHYYQNSIKQSTDGFTHFLASYEEDKKLLINLGINSLDIDIIPDILRNELA